MTDCALATNATPAAATTGGRVRPSGPPGVPPWMRFLGVVLVPLDGRAGSRRTWVLSAGAGTSHVAALLVDDPSDD